MSISQYVYNNNNNNNIVFHFRLILLVHCGKIFTKLSIKNATKLGHSVKNSLPPAPQASPEDLEVTLEEGVASLHSFLTTDSSSFLSVEASHFLPPPSSPHVCCKSRNFHQ